MQFRIEALETVDYFPQLLGHYVSSNKMAVNNINVYFTNTLRTPYSKIPIVVIIISLEILTD